MIIVTILFISQITIISTEWKSILGIPDPSFGILESHTMYTTSQYDFGNGLEPYKINSQGGPYTHIVNPSIPAATDIDNVYGTPVQPRLTIPSDLSAGSVVEIQGGPLSSDTLRKIEGKLYIWIYNSQGTKEKPIFIRGYDSEPANMIEVYEHISIKQSSYVIVENMKCRPEPGKIPGDGKSRSGIGVSRPNDHIVVRNCEHTGHIHDSIYGSPFSSIWGTGGSSSEPSTNWNEDIVYYNNRMYDNWNNYGTKSCPGCVGEGINWPPYMETGGHCFTIGKFQRRVWFIDNIVTDGPEDGVQINGGNDGSEIPEYLYIGRNVFGKCGENAVDVKQSDHVIISENEMYGYQGVTTMVNNQGSTSGSDGAAVVINDDSPNPNNWIIFNKFYDSEKGLRCQNQCHAISNVFYNIHKFDKTGYDPSGCWEARAALSGWGMGTEESYWVYNTIVGCDAGIGYCGGNAVKLRITNNIIANNIEATAQHISIVDNTNAEEGSNLFYQNGGSVLIDFDNLKDVSSLNDGINDDPLFVNEGNNNYFLQPNSPAINSGDESVIFSIFYGMYGIDIAKDFYGNDRPQNGSYDRGAFEWCINCEKINHKYKDGIGLKILYISLASVGGIIFLIALIIGVIIIFYFSYKKKIDKYSVINIQSTDDIQ